MRKPLMVLAIVGCLVLAVVGALLPIVQGWMFMVLALYLVATEFESGRRWVRQSRRRWPVLTRWIANARAHRWSPRYLQRFDELTDPEK